MLSKNLQPLKNTDIITFCLCLSLLAIGWLMVFTVGYNEGYEGGVTGFFSTQAGKQTMWIGIAVLLYVAVLLIDWKIWQTFAYFIYGFSLIALLGLFVVGTKVKGATSWYTFGGFSFQPSELAKFATCLAVAAFLSRYSANLKDLRSQATALILILLPMALILLQPDAGSALVFLSFLLVFYREGLSPNYYIVGGFMLAMLLLGFAFPVLNTILGLVVAAAVLICFNLSPRINWSLAGGVLIAGAIMGYQSEDVGLNNTLIAAGAVFAVMAVVAIRKKQQRLAGLLTVALIVGSLVSFAAHYTINEVLKPHQAERIKVWLTPNDCDPSGPRYNLEKSKMAISSGGPLGKGFLNGTMTKLNYVPEQTTDFIFCTIGEEQGFVGSTAIVIFYLLLLIRITLLAERQRTAFARVYAYSVCGIFFIHFFINIGMTMGLMPIIGIPLPFISKGGSSLLGFTLMIAVLLKLDSNRYRG